MVQIKKEIVEKIKHNSDLKLKIALGTGKGYSTVELWLRKNSHLLTTATCLSIIARELNTPVSKLTENKKLK